MEEWGALTHVEHEGIREEEGWQDRGIPYNLDVRPEDAVVFVDGSALPKDAASLRKALVDAMRLAERKPDAGPKEGVRRRTRVFYKRRWREASKAFGKWSAAADRLGPRIVRTTSTQSELHQVNVSVLCLPPLPTSWLFNRHLAH
jgi:hypothetical protein